MRRKRLDSAEAVARLIALRLMVSGMAGAMPRMAADLRREACEAIDDLIEDIGGGRA